MSAPTYLTDELALSRRVERDLVETAQRLRREYLELRDSGCTDGVLLVEARMKWGAAEVQRVAAENAVYGARDRLYLHQVAGPTRERVSA